MCEPTTIALAIGAGMGALGQHQQGQAQDAQRDAIGRQGAIRAEEIQAQEEERIGTRIREARRERARARVAAAEGGVGGQSFALQLKDSLFQQDLDTASSAKNLSIQTRANFANVRSAQAGVGRTTGLDILQGAISGGQAGLQIGKQFPTD